MTGTDPLLPERLRRLERLRRVARLLDTSIRVPGTRFRIGLDPLLGLLPGVGDVAGLGAALWIVAEARALGVPRATLTRMLVDVGVDAAVGSIPLLGDLFDAFYKANLENVRRIERHLGVLDVDAHS